jgi:hypothetical protein
MRLVKKIIPFAVWAMALAPLAANARPGTMSTSLQEKVAQTYGLTAFSGGHAFATEQPISQSASQNIGLTRETLSNTPENSANVAGRN